MQSACTFYIEDYQVICSRENLKRNCHDTKSVEYDFAAAEES